MFGVSRIKFRAQPPGVQKKVFEFQVGGWLGKKMTSGSWMWTGTTFVFPFFVIILYYVGLQNPTVKPSIRVHEFQHVRQAQDSSFFFIWWIKYLIEARHGYSGNKYEREAYLIERSWIDRSMLPDWAQP